MAKQDKISSTERLLSLIRDDESRENDNDEVIPARLPAKDKPFFYKLFSSRKTSTVGVDIGDNCVRLVEIKKISDNQFRLSAYAKIPFKPGIDKKNARFPLFLRSVLTSFCGNLKTVHIWCTLASPRIQTKHFNIPKLPGKQIANAVYWTYQKNIPFNPDDKIFDYEITEPLTENGVRKTGVTAYTVPGDEIKGLKDIFQKSGFPLSGISVIPFIFRNFSKTGWIELGSENVCSIFINSKWTSISIFSGENLLLSRNVKAGIDSLTDSLKVKIYKKKQEAGDKPSENSHKAWSSGSLNDDYKVLFGFISISRSLAEDIKALELSEEEIFEMLHPALDRLILQADRTFRHLLLNFGIKGVEKIYLYGRVGLSRRVIDYISKKLTLPIENVDPLFLLNKNSNKKNKAPDSREKRIAFSLAVGAALSDNLTTQNLLFTYKEKEKLAIVRRTTIGLFTSLIVIMAICVGVYFSQSHIADRKKVLLSKLTHDIEQYTPIIDRNLLLGMAAQAGRKNELLKNYSDKYLGMAVIGEISGITPSTIRIISITADLGLPRSYYFSDGGKIKKQNKNITINGIVSGDRMAQDASLTGYLLNLKKTPIFTKPVVKKKTFEFFDNKEVLHFIVQFKLV